MNLYYLRLFCSLTDDKETISTAKDIFFEEITSNNGEFRGEDVDATSTTFEGENSPLVVQYELISAH